MGCVIVGFSDEEMAYYKEFVENNAHLNMEFAKEDLRMPRIFKFGGYIIFFWSNENKPTKSIHVHIAKYNPRANSTKIWITKRGKAFVCNNNS